MNRTTGVAVLISGIFFSLCGLLHVFAGLGGTWAKACDLDTVLFLGSGVALIVGGILLLTDVHLTAPGSLMVRRGQA